MPTAKQGCIFNLSLLTKFTIPGPQVVGVVAQVLPVVGLVPPPVELTTSKVNLGHTTPGVSTHNAVGMVQSLFCIPIDNGPLIRIGKREPSALV
jgi:hypothetical protein